MNKRKPRTAPARPRPQKRRNRELASQEATTQGAQGQGAQGQYAQGQGAPSPDSPDQPASGQGARGRGGDGRIWLYGVHTACAAAANPRRRCHRLVAAPACADRLRAAAKEAGAPRPAVETGCREDLDALLPPGAVHQGLAVLADPLPDITIEALIAAIEPSGTVRIVVLDQVTDPRNVGAILRSAAAFGASAVVVQDRHAPPITPVLAKAASGALEQVPMVRVVNLTRALRQLQAADVWCLALDPEADDVIAAESGVRRAAVVIGAEGAGLRPLVRDTCDRRLRIPIAVAIGSLNAAAAATIALYELARTSGSCATEGAAEHG
ncbi:MAG: RNA methyltransferase [Rhodospirillales bacterium]|nr:RNA methyltransferase [Rhodospirillales bacterium]